jgi:hypothetical protein
MQRSIRHDLTCSKRSSQVAQPVIVIGSGLIDQHCGKPGQPVRRHIVFDELDLPRCACREAARCLMICHTSNRTGHANPKPPASG